MNHAATNHTPSNRAYRSDTWLHDDEPAGRPTPATALIPEERRQIVDSTAPEPGLTQLMERSEAQYFHRFLDRAPQSTRIRLGLRTTHIGDGIAAAMTADRSGYWTKAMGYGFATPVDDTLIADTIQFFTAAGKDDATVALAPAVLPEDWQQICDRHGLTAAGSWAKLACPVDEFVVRGTTDLTVRQLTRRDVPAWNHIIGTVFGMADPDLSDLLRTTVDDPAAQVFGAWDDDLLVSAGAVHLLGDLAALNTGATLPTHRGRGAQTAVINARVDAAADAGCLFLTAETGSTHDNPSFRNLLRSGFTHHYDRTNWHWRSDTAR